MNPTAPQLFTAAQFAAALGKSRQAISDRLAGISPDDLLPVKNKPARHWRLASLPESLRAELEQAARVGGYRDVPSMLAAPALDWQAPLPLAQCSDECIAKARQLREALGQALELRNNSLIPPARLTEIGLADYARLMGHPITERHWRELFNRTRDRAGEAEVFDRLELYLPERPQRRAETTGEKAPLEFSNLKQLIESFAAPAAPTAEEKSSLWDAAFLALSESGAPNETRRSLIAFLHAHAPKLALTVNALRVSFERKFNKWTQDGETLTALDDGRSLRVQAVHELDELERLFLINLCSRYENVSLGWRKFLESDHASPITKQVYGRSSAVQPRVPEWVRKLVTRDALIQRNHIRGPRTAKLNGAHIERDPNALASGDSDQSDDLTLPLVWFERTPEGLFIGQGQLLVWIDERSWLIYGMDLISDGAYTGFSVRNSWTKKAEAHGLPRKKIHVENGIWRSAKVFVGTDEQIGTKQTEMGLRRLGIRFHHATLPRGKVIERCFGSLQDLLQMDRGYVGRNQMLDRYERVQKQLQLVKGGHAEPEEFFSEKREVLKRLEDIAAEMNTTPKHGKYHEGRSPQQVYEECFTTPLVKIPAQLRHLLSMNKVETTVGRNGVSFRYGNRTYRYKNSVELGQQKGARVCAWFSPENPDFCSITNLAGENPIVVPLEPLVPADGATAEQMTAAYASNANFERYHKDLHRAIRTTFPPEFEQRRFRPVFADAQSMELGRQISEQTDALQTEQRQDQTTRQRTHRKARELGFSPSALVDDPERANRGMDLIAQARKRNAQSATENGAGETDESGGAVAVAAPVKTYALHVPPVVEIAKLRKQVWAAWHRVEQARPEMNRPALTQKTLSHNHSINDFTAAECAQMLDVFAAIQRASKNKGNTL